MSNALCDLWPFLRGPFPPVDFAAWGWLAQLEPAPAWDILTSLTLWSCLIVATSALVQATVGFAAALLGLPLLLWAGNDMIQAQVLLVTGMMPQHILGVWKLRHSIDWREVVWPASIRIAALPIGIAGLAVVVTWSADRVQQFVGVLILLALATQTLVGVQWRSARRPGWMILVFGGSGVLQGISGMSGPPVVLWVFAQRFTHDHARAFMFAMAITNFLPQVLLLWWKFGSPVLQAMGVALLALPLVLLSALLGLRLGSRLGSKWLRPATFAVLLWIGLSSLLRPWIAAYLFP